MSGETGVATDDFSQIYSDFKRTVSYKIVTKTTDPMTGSETSSFGSANNVDVIFFLNENRWMFDKEGLLEMGDAYIMAPTSTGIARYDQFTVDGNTFYIENVIRRHVTSVAMVDYAVCFQVA